MATKYSTAELKQSIDGHEVRIVTLETGAVERRERITEVRKDLDKYCNITDELQKVVISSESAIKIGTWIIVGFGGSVIALIWSLITGQASLIFK